MNKAAEWAGTKTCLYIFGEERSYLVRAEKSVLPSETQVADRPGVWVELQDLRYALSPLDLHTVT